MNQSWDRDDDGSAYTMNSVDLLSKTTSEHGDADQNQLEGIVEGRDETQEPPPETMQVSIGTIYQIDLDAEHTGKHRPQSKRNISWKYGIPEKTEDGAFKVREHEAKLVWSTHSGKYAIYVDGEEVHSHTAKGSVLEYKWKWNHARACICNEDDDSHCVRMRIIACRKPPIRSNKDFRCYEFIIAGKVFRELPILGSGNHQNNAEFQNEENELKNGQLLSILDIIEPGWRSDGFA
ncbi:hypothetical protein ACHAXS_003465 [Conticribra weissflogii]